VGFSYNASSNQLNGYGYDQAGDVTNDGTYSYQWDAEAHLTAVYQSGNVVSLNTYNALGQRVEDVTQSSTTDEAYGAGGALLARYTGDSNSRSFVPFGGGLLAEYYCGGMTFDHPDEIGSATTATDCTGNNIQERLYYPYGEFWTGANPDNLGMHQEFAKLPDYDPEIDEYKTANRHYSPMGRWMSPDPGGVKVVRLDDPQTWNMYAYARNNPTTVTDPSGLVPQNSVVQENGGSDPNEAVDLNLEHRVKEGTHNVPPQAQNKDKAQVKVKKQRYEAASRGTTKGVTIKLNAQVRCGGYKDLNWVQKITTNAPLGNNPANQPYVDRDPGQQTPFYLNPQEQAQSENIVPGPLPSTTTFSDQPTREFSGSAISWHADLSLVGIKGDGTFDTLKSFSYGFTLDAQGVHLDPLTGVQ